VGIAVEATLLGEQVEAMSDRELSEAAERATVFARLAPAHKQRVVNALRDRGRVVGFLGDGINDAPALRAADVGISVDSAADIAKESADLILLEKSLMVLDDGILEGRKVFANILKYIRMGASSSFGNMLSVVGASAFLPFVPMAPLQILTNNLLYDFSQVPIPTDDVDPEQIARPRPWSMDQIAKFILFIGPCSSVFDYTTYFAMMFVFGARCVARPAVPDRMVRRVAAHPDADHPRHSHQPRPVPAEPFQSGPRPHDLAHHGGRCLASVLALRRDARSHRAPRSLLAAGRRDAARLRALHAGGEGVAGSKGVDLTGLGSALALCCSGEQKCLQCMTNDGPSSRTT
jgi:hypothetical protein